MPKLLLSLIVFMAVITAVAVHTVPGDRGDSRRPETGPEASVDHPVHDFGTVLAGKSVQHEFVIRNTGDAPLEILSVKTG
ncbi:MAG: DUF1573 domain-containing protein [Desulfobacteraceae bacterium]|nr:DUF1573 domain-containing protein [Desulfobacteraceae bacterium]MCF8035244.1 DUF1573 domain-containing protein [Desulfobacteraceae bacterium]